MHSYSQPEDSSCQIEFKVYIYINMWIESNEQPKGYQLLNVESTVLVYKTQETIVAHYDPMEGKRWIQGNNKR